MNDFFSIISKSSDESGRYTYIVRINPEHPIFKGHFPGKPIVPGVMTLFMTRLCAQDALSLGETRVCAIKEAKYFAPIIPDGNNVKIAFSVDADLNIQADVTSEDGADFTKIRATLTR